MAAHQADLPDKYVLGDSWGLGWIRFGWDGQRLIGHDGNTLGQAAFLRVLPDSATGGLAVTLLTNGGSTPRPLRGPLPRDLRRARRRRDAATAHAAAAAARARPSTSRRTSAPTSAPSVRMEVFAGDDGPVLRTDRHRPARRAGARPGRRVPAGPVRPGAVPGQAAGGRDLVRRSRSTSCRPASATCTSARGRHRRWTDRDRRSPSCSTTCGPGRVRVPVRRPRRRRPLGRRRGAGRHGPARRRAGADRARRPDPPALAARQRSVAGAAARPPRHGLAARLAGDAPVRGRATACCAGRAAST